MAHWIPVGSIFGVHVVVLDEKEDEMEQTFDEAMKKLQKLNTIDHKRGFNRIVIYGDASGHLEDGNNEEVFSFFGVDDLHDELDKEIAARTGEWTADVDGTSYFLVHERFGLRYPIAPDFVSMTAKPLAEKMKDIANKTFPMDSIPPVGVNVLFNDWDDSEVSGVVIAHDTNSEIDLLVAYSEFDEEEDDYAEGITEWVDSDEVKIAPRDQYMRMMLLEAALANGVDVKKLGLL